MTHRQYRYGCFCPEEKKGWSATIKSIVWEHKYKCITN